MKTMRKRRALQILVAILLSTTLLIPGLLSSSTAQDEAIFDSPLPNPPVPTPTPIPSTEAQVALRYIAERYEIPVEQLAIVNEHHREYSELDRTFQAFTLLDLANGRFFNLLVDLKDHAVVEDVAAIQRAEEDAYQKRYGKLEPALYERLQKAADDEPIEVAIWIAGTPRRSQQELFAELAARFPEAQTAMERSGKPFDVQDPELRAKIERAYESMGQADMQPLTQPVVEFLEAQGSTVTTYGAMPSVTGMLPKKLILALSERPDVGRIFLIEGEGALLLDSAVPSDRVLPVWQAGIDGTGSSIAILETDNVDFTSNSQDCPAGTNNCFRHPGPTPIPGTDGEGYHATLVASSAASDHWSHKGVAPDATIYSVGMTADTEAGFLEGLGRALNSNGVHADVVNVSWGTGHQSDMRWSDKTLDYWAYYYQRMIVLAAGNTDQCTTGFGSAALCSPAKAWNVISVGGYDDANSANWSDDTMPNWSSYVNPPGDHGDREKPEVVAPGANIKGIGIDGSLITQSGTSYASPQVAGLAASLIERRPVLRGWPEASRAIIMASAVHNIEGPSGIPPGQELKDGAGGIDAALADLTAKTQWWSETSPCTGPCWWGIQINNNNFPVDSWLYRYFNASRGEHIRAAISWWAHAYCPSENDCAFDRLDTDLQLFVIDPDGQWVPGVWSASWDNNYELVDFTAPKTGTYKLGIYKQRADEDFNYLGLAWVKDATYLPDVRGNYDGWTSRFRIRNDGAQPRAFVVTFYDSDGFETAITLPSLNHDQVFSFNAATFVGSGWVGSAIVDGGEDVSVVVKTTGSQEVTGYGGFQFGSGLGYAAPGSTLYAPYVYRHYYNWHSFLSVQNTGSTSTNVTVTYRYDSGGIAGSKTLTVVPGAFQVFDPDNVDTPPGGMLDGLLYSAAISSSNGQPLAAVVTSKSLNTPYRRMDYNAASQGDSTLFFPVIFKNYYNFNTALQILNVSDLDSLPVRRC